MQTLLRAALSKTDSDTRSEIHFLDPLPLSLLSTDKSLLNAKTSIVC